MAERRRPLREVPHRLLYIAAWAILGGAGLVLALQSSVAGVFSESSPAIALKFAPFNADARATLAEQIVDAKAGGALANRLALDSVRRDPIEPVALRSMAQALELKSPGSPRATTLMLASQRLSRRDTLTQLWFIRRASARDQPEEVMHHFDVALRASSAAGANLFPLLLTASKDGALRASLLRSLSTRPVWAKAFAIYAVREGDDLVLAAELAPRLLNARIADDRVLFQNLLDRLSQAERYDLAWGVYQATGVARASSVALLRAGTFDGANTFPPFDWWFSDDPDLLASRERGSDGGLLLRVSASNGRSGEVARQLVRLTPGAYRLSALVGDLPEDPMEWPTLRVRCADGDKASLVTIRPVARQSHARQLAVAFEVPDKCHFQWLAIEVGGDGPPPEIAASVDDIVISRTR